MQQCALCGRMDGELAWTAFWRIVLNRNQDRLGKCFLVLERHELDVCNLGERELADLWIGIRSVKDALSTLFQPDQFNYMFLMNQDAHVHLHVVPRYGTPRTFAGVEFPVIDSLDGGQHRLAPETFAQLVAAMRAQLAQDTALALEPDEEWRAEYSARVDARGWPA